MFGIRLFYLFIFYLYRRPRLGLGERDCRSFRSTVPRGGCDVVLEFRWADAGRDGCDESTNKSHPVGHAGQRINKKEIKYHFEPDEYRSSPSGCCVSMSFIRLWRSYKIKNKNKVLSSGCVVLPPGTAESFHPVVRLIIFFLFFIFFLGQNKVLSSGCVLLPQG